MSKTRMPETAPTPSLPAETPTGPANLGKPLPPASAKSKAFYTIRQLAERWGLSERQVHRFIAADALIATRFGRSVRVGAGEVARFEAERFGVD